MHRGVELVILMGLQGAGKSTFYGERFATTHALVSLDRLRTTSSRPRRRQEHLVAQALAAGRSVVVDNTNATPADRALLIAMGREHGAVIVGYYFVVPLADALKRNRQRGGRARVPHVAMDVTANKLAPPNAAEGFDHLYEVRITEGGAFAVCEWGGGDGGGGDGGGNQTV